MRKSWSSGSCTISKAPDENVLKNPFEYRSGKPCLCRCIVSKASLVAAASSKASLVAAKDPKASLVAATHGSDEEVSDFL